MPKNNKLKPFIPLRKDMLKSQEWRKLSSKAKVIYLYLRNNANGKIDYIKLPYSSLDDMMSHHTIAKGFKELQDSGLIKQISRGGKFGSPAIYNFTGFFASPYQSRRK